MPPKTVLITGCSDASIGSALAHAFYTAGHEVFASARDLSKMASLAGLQGSRMHLLTLDITSPPSIAATLEQVQRRTNGTLDILVNNAGRQHVGPLLELDVEGIKSTFDTNVFAHLSVTQAFAPLLIAAKGTVVNVSSISAVVNCPFIGVYNASKAALAMFSETLRLEMRPLGVRVLTLMAGAVGTNLQRNIPPASAKLAEGSMYAAAQADIDHIARNGKCEKPTDVDVFARDVVRMCLETRTEGRVWRGVLATLFWWVSRVAPDWVMVSLFLFKWRFGGMCFC